MLIYLLAAIGCYWANLTIGYEIEGRVPFFPNEKDPWWQHEVNVFRAIKHDLFGLHCPWSWETAISYRVKYAHQLLHSMRHEKGWRPEDCHNPDNHLQIAIDCFRSRKYFWIRQSLQFIFSPILLFVHMYAQMKFMGM